MELINSEKYLIFDTHAHYDDEKFNDMPNVFETIKQNGVIGVINCAVDLRSSETAIDFSEKYDYFWAAVGIHPENMSDEIIDFTELENLCKHKKVVAIGEIGLDYYWDKSNIQQQKTLFEKQVVIANKIGLPVIVHDRDAHNDTLEILKKNRPSGVVHCFSGSAEMANEVLKIGMYIGIGGVATFKNARKTIDVIKMLPLDRLLLETDSPYMAPEPFRGKINHSDYIYYVGKKIAEIKNIPPSDVFNASLENTKTLFSKIK